MAKVSVIIPVYNVEKYLRECLTSVCNQTFRDLEIICINDGATDNSLKILEEFALKDSRIHIITQINQGLSGARNTGLKTATGNYIAFIDSDDYVSENFIETLYNKAISEDADISACCVTYLEDGKFIKDNHINKQTFKTQKEVFNSIEDKISFMGSVVVWNKLYKTELLRNAELEFVKGCKFEDTYFTFLAIAFANKITVNDSAEYIYRINNSSIMANVYESEKLFDIIKIMDYLGAEVEKKVNSNQLDSTYKKIYDSYVIGILYSWYKKISKKYLKEFQIQIIQRLKNIETTNNEYIDKKTRRRLNKILNSQKPIFKRLFNLK